MGSPETSVQIPAWLENAMKPLLKGATQRYNKYAKQGENRVGSDMWKFDPREVVGQTGMEERAAKMAKTLGQRGLGQLDQSAQWLREAMAENADTEAGRKALLEGKDIAAEKVTGESLGKDKAIQAAQDRFASAMLPMIQNQAAMAGLGRSNTMTNAISAQQAQTMLPLIQEGLAREERGIGRRLDEAGQRASGLLQLGQATKQGLLQGSGQMQGLAGEKFQRALTQMGALQQAGESKRGVRQEQLDARFNERMRRLGQYEQALSGPLGMVPGVFGSKTEKW